MTINIRWNQHLNAIKSHRDDNTILYRAMKKYGVENFTISKIMEYAFYSKDELIKTLNKEEIRYISEYNSVNPYGYNMQLGGKSPTESLKRPVDKYSLNGEFIKSYESILEACLDAGENEKYNRVHISECCSGKLYTSSGYVWRFKDDSFDKYDTVDKRYKAIDLYSTDGVFINHYNSISEAICELFNSDYLEIKKI